MDSPERVNSPERVEGGDGEPDEIRRILVRYSGELSTKAKATRRRFEHRLVRNLRDALYTTGARGNVRVTRTRDRVIVDSGADLDPAPLARVFGVQSVSSGVRRPWSSLEDLVRSGEALFGDAVAGRRFAIRARRVGDRTRIRVQSQDLERALGTVLLERSAGVDLTSPEVTCRIEITAGEAHFLEETIRGPGGLPIGVEGRAVSLVSGGFDSAVATWMIAKRGVDLDLVFCNLGGRAHQLEALRVLRILACDWSYGARPHLHAIDFDAVARDLQSHVEQRYWQIVLKRLMLRAAERVARDRGADVIVTGDAIGQVSSQTLRNLAVISDATPLPILRPLVGFNKDEILAIARRIGTHDRSAEVGEYCAMVPGKPATAATRTAVLAEEEKLDPALLERAIAERSVLDLRILDLAALEVPGLETTEIREGDTLLDLRSKAAYQAWHYPGALFLDFAHALRAHSHMKKDAGRYVLYCEFGLKSAHLAELMRREGFEAVHFAKGLASVITHARDKGLETPTIASHPLDEQPPR